MRVKFAWSYYHGADDEHQKCQEVSAN
jgi:hypothetical protein